MVKWKAIIEKNKLRPGYYTHIYDENDSQLLYFPRCENVQECLSLIYELNISNKNNNLVYTTENSENNKIIFSVYSKDTFKEFGFAILDSDMTDPKNYFNLFVSILNNKGEIIDTTAATDVYYDVEQMTLNNINTTQSTVEIPFDPNIMNYMFSLDGVGFDNSNNALQENPTDIKQWEHNDSIFWSNKVLREQFLNIILKLGDNYEK